MKEAIYVTRSAMPGFDEYIEEIEDIWETRQLSNKGPKHQKLERLLKEYMGVSNISLFSNGHLALESAIEALDLEGEIITSPFTFVSTTHAIVRKGLKPIFCDIRPDNYTIDVQKLEGLITEATSAILPVHVYGNICDIEGIVHIAKKYGLKILYDAAHAFGVKINGVDAGNFGDVSMYSFHATKVFHTIEGGALAFRDGNMKSKLDSLANFGIGGNNVEYVSGNAKMNEFQAAMGICNLRHIESQIVKRKSIAFRYRENLESIKGVILPGEINGIQSNYAYFPVVFIEEICGKSRDEIYEGLIKEQIYSRKYFYPLVTELQCYKDAGASAETPVAEYISKRILCLPLYADLTFSQVDRICKVIGDLIG